MKNGLTKAILIAGFVLPGSMLFAQGEGISGSNILIYTIVAVVVLVVLGLIFQVGDNLLAVEAKNTGADRKSANYSILPKFSEIMRPKLPEHATGKSVTYLSRGHNILLQGVAEGDIQPANVNRYALQPTDFIGISPIPKLYAEVGDTVQAGDPLMFDKKRPEITFVAPVSGELIELNRGAKRAITEIVILADKDQQYKRFDVPNLNSVSRADLTGFLLESGAWTLFRQRPYNILPEPTDLPRDIFISTFDTAPLAPDLNLVVAGNEKAFQRGLDVLNKMTDGSVYLGLSANGAKPSAAFTDATGVKKHYFQGKHPAGNVGVQIHHIKPINVGDKVWTLGVQEVITLGKLFTDGIMDMSVVVALTGAELEQPKYVRTKRGANIGELLAGNLKNDHVRIVNGDVLSGQKKELNNYVGYYDDQITVIEEGDDYEMFGWLLPLSPRPTISGTFPNFLYPNYRFEANTNTHGERRAFVVTGEYEKVLPMDIYPQHLFKSIMFNDFERMEGLGIYELVEEDVALCEFVCTSKQPLQRILRQGLDLVREQG